MRSAMARSPITYSCIHSVASGAAVRTSSMRVFDAVERMKGTRAACAAPASNASARGRTSPASPMGATANGARQRRPNSSMPMSTVLVSRRQSGISGSASIASRLRRMQRSSSAPPST